MTLSLRKFKRSFFGIINFLENQMIAGEPVWHNFPLFWKHHSDLSWGAISALNQWGLD